MYFFSVVFSKIRKKYGLAVLDFRRWVDLYAVNLIMPTKIILVLLFFWVEFVVLRLQITITH